MNFNWKSPSSAKAEDKEQELETTSKGFSQQYEVLMFIIFGEKETQNFIEELL